MGLAHTAGTMARVERAEIREGDLRGLRHFKKLRGLLAALHDHATARDRAGNRTLHYDQYVLLVLLHLFNPVSSGLRSICRASALPKVRRALGVSRTSLGSFSEAARVFDPRLLEGVIGELAAGLRPVVHDPRLSQVKQVLTLVDGTILRALPRVAEAMWLTNASGNAHHAWRLHTHFELLVDAPTRVELTDARNSQGSAERNVLGRSLAADRLYAMDRGYVRWSLLNAIVAAGSGYVCRLREDTLEEVVEERPLTPEAEAAGVVRDAVVRLGATGNGAKPSARTDHPVRLIEVPITPHVKRGGRKGRDAGPANAGLLRLATNRLDLPAEVVALVYRYRYAIEIFFRFFKQLLGCRHLISDCADGVRIQCYCAMIACMLINLYTGRKVDRGTWEMCCYFAGGLADEADLLAYLNRPDRAGEKLRAKDALWKKLGVN
jgi:hypothetical protein